MKRARGNNIKKKERYVLVLVNILAPRIFNMAPIFYTHEVDVLCYRLGVRQSVSDFPSAL